MSGSEAAAGAGAQDRLAIARSLREIGERLRLAEASPFRARAFLRGASALESVAADVGTLLAEDRLRELPGVGAGLSRVIEELHRTGRSALLERLRGETPPGALELSRLRWMTLPRIQALQQQLGIQSLDALEAACEAGRVREVTGFGPKTEARLLEEIRRQREGQGRLPLHRATEVAESLVEHLRGSAAVAGADYAGELRRRHELVSGLSVVASGASAAPALDRLAAFPLVERVVSRAASESEVALANGLPVHLSWVPAPQHAAALVRLTGSPDHWRRLQDRARELRLQGGLPGLAAAREAELYERLGLPYIPPELREDEGEIEAALAGTLPADLVRLEDIRGMVHCHTHHSDGRDTVLAMAQAAEALGMRYITITDHSPTASYAGGLSLERLERQWEEIERAQEQTSVRILRGTESDILADGSLDYPDQVLERLDVIVASVHNRHRMDEHAMTRRVVAALSLPLFKIWGHARGRLIGRRAPFACRMEEILDAAAGARVAIEVSGDPYRLDMEPRWVREARARGLRFVVSVDAHSVAELRNLRYGVDMARRGWVRRHEVLNTLPPDDFAAAVKPV
jgi:DNA polymerase (family 10)